MSPRTVASDEVGIICPPFPGTLFGVTIVSVGGHCRGTEHAEEAIVHVAELDDGVQVTLSPGEFAKRFGWQNDPQRVNLSGTAP